MKFNKKKKKTISVHTRLGGLSGLDYVWHQLMYTIGNAVCMSSETKMEKIPMKKDESGKETRKKEKETVLTFEGWL